MTLRRTSMFLTTSWASHGLIISILYFIFQMIAWSAEKSQVEDFSKIWELLDRKFEDTLIDLIFDPKVSGC